MNDSYAPLLEATQRVAAEYQDAYPDLDASNLREVARYVRDVITLDDPAPVGAATLIDYGDALSDAYRVVLEATDAEVDALPNGPVLA